MNLLAIDTSTKNFSLAVSRAGKIAAEKNIILDKILSDSIVPGLEAILRKAKLTLHGLDGFVVGLGPGSFTSLRVGLSTVKALAFSLHKPILGIVSLDALALGAPLKEGDICVINDARREMVYTASYRKSGMTIERILEYQLAPLVQALKNVPRGAFFTGDAVSLYRKSIATQFPKSKFASSRSSFPQAKWLIPLAEDKFRKGKFDDAETIVPLYLYAQDCQVDK